MRRWVALGAAVGVLAAGGSAAWAGRRKATLRCRKVLAEGLRVLVDAGLASLDACHETRHRTATDCNSLAGALDFQRAQFRADGIVSAFCLAGNPILANYPMQPGLDTVSVVAKAIQRRLEASGQALQSARPPSGPARRCSRAIGRARSALVGRVVATAIRCQTRRDRRRSALGSIESTCLGSAPGVAARGAASIARACLGVTGASVGSCDPLPECVLTSAITTGQAIARDIYGSLPSERTSLCGNGVLDVGEFCDDGNRNDNDACTNACVPAKCGDAIVETGAEQCDDGNNVETDSCTPLCKLARCGDGIVETGVEQCDDGDGSPGTLESGNPGNDQPGDVCNGQCKFIQVTCPPWGSLQAILSLFPNKDGSSAAFNGIEVDVGYPAGLTLPGSGFLSMDDPTDQATRIALNPEVMPSLYSSLQTFFDTDSALFTTITVTAGSEVTFGRTPLKFERVRFDCTPGTIFSPAQLTCTVPDESNRANVTIQPAGRPTCRLSLTRVKPGVLCQPPDKPELWPDCPADGDCTECRPCFPDLTVQGDCLAP